MPQPIQAPSGGHGTRALGVRFWQRLRRSASAAASSRRSAFTSATASALRASQAFARAGSGGVNAGLGVRFL